MKLKDKVKHFAIGAFVPGSITYNFAMESLSERRNQIARNEGTENLYELMSYNLMNALCDGISYVAGYGIPLLEVHNARDMPGALAWAAIVGVGYRGLANVFARTSLEDERSKAIPEGTQQQLS